MKILVTGGAGYIGSHTVKELIKENYRVIVFDNLSDGHIQAVPKNAKFIKGNISNQKLLENVIKKEKIDAVIHFAGSIIVPESVKNPAKYFSNNFSYGINLLEAIKNTGVEYIIYSSSAGVYGNPERVPIKEDDYKNPVNTYGRTKLMFEGALKSYEEACDLKWIALRYFNAAGASKDAEIGEDHKPETHIIPLLIQTAMFKRDKFTIYGNDYPTPDGTCVRDYIHVEDLAIAHIKALNQLQNDNQSNIYNLGIGKGFSNLQLVEATKKISNVNFKVNYGPKREGDPAQLIADSHRAQKDLNWQPKYVTIESIIETAWKWHQSHPRGFKN